MLIVLEGLDGCGKTSVGEAVARALEGKLLHFPDRTTPTGELIEAYLKGQWELDYDKEKAGWVLPNPRTFQALNVANRMEHMEELQRAVGAAGMDEGEDLVLSRYWPSGWVYGQLDGLEPEWLASLHGGMADADLYFFLDVAPEEALRRRVARDGEMSPERYEGKLEKLQQARGLFQKLWESEQEKIQSEDQWIIVDAMLSMDKVVADVMKHVCRSLRSCG